MAVCQSQIFPQFDDYQGVVWGGMCDSDHTKEATQ